MKRLIITLVVFCVAFSAHAQFYAGGGFRIANNFDAPGSIFSLEPEIGYNLSDKLAVGGAFGLFSSRIGDNRSSSFSFQPYARYTFASIGILNFFVDGAVKLTTHKGGGGAWEFGAYPGIAIPLDGRFSFVAHMGQLSFSSDSVFTLGLDNSVSAGLFFHF